MHIHFYAFISSELIAHLCFSGIVRNAKWYILKNTVEKQQQQTNKKVKVSQSQSETGKLCFPWLNDILMHVTQKWTNHRSLTKAITLDTKIGITICYVD